MAPEPHDALAIQWHLTCARFSEWLQNDLFRWRWWLLVALYIGCIYIWWKTVDKSRLKEIVLYTAMIIVIILALDELGEELTLWDYPTDIFPLFPPISAIDFSCMPLIYSLIYQHCRTWRKFIIATLLMAAIFCFICEPLFVFLGIYQPLTWKYYYGFPIYTAMAIGIKAVVILFYKIAAKSRDKVTP
jgi:hypothetical protein